MKGTGQGQSQDQDVQSPPQVSLARTHAHREADRRASSPWERPLAQSSTVSLYAHRLLYDASRKAASGGEIPCSGAQASAAVLSNFTTMYLGDVIGVGIACKHNPAQCQQKQVAAHGWQVAAGWA